MKYVNLQIALHHHQPVGNPPGVLEDCFRKCYGPILDAIERHPRLKFNLSYSGPLLLFFEKNHPEYLEKLKWLIAARQVEVLSDGFYEPIFAEIGEDDRRDQIRLMHEWMDSRLGITPKGIWLAEGVWENSLAATFHRAGLDYTLIGGEHFIQAGVPEADLHGYHVTEHFGRVLRLFPRDSNLHRLIPYGAVEELIAYLRRMANRGLGLSLTFYDHAERWGVWPGSHEKVQQSGCMDRLFAVLSEAGDWLRLKTFTEVLAGEPPRGRCYIPAGPGTELGMWSLPDESRKQFVSARQNLEQRHDAGRFLPFFRAGSWGGFRGRYFESNLMEKKGLWLKSHLDEAPAADREAVRDLLWQCQCNTAYWHGTSGGIYLPGLRQAIWRRLLEAQTRIWRNLTDFLLEITDFDADGREEVQVSNSRISMGLAPERGGSVFEFSLLPPRHNLANTLTRRPESDLNKGDSARPDVSDPAHFFDTVERRCFLDRFFNRHTTTEELNQGRFRELGDFANGSYRLVRAEKAGGGVEVELERLGGFFQSGARQALRVGKTYRWEADGSSFSLRYKIRNEGQLRVESCFSTEMNFFVPLNDTGLDRVVLPGKIHLLDESWYEGQSQTLEIQGGSSGFALSVRADQPVVLWSYPVLGKSEADMGSPLVRQGNAWLCGWQLDLKPEEEASYELKFELTQLAEKKFENIRGEFS
ncbi:MAG: DUF1926 domain-containing protein [Methylacidiphilales bacterium]|nr:DUF1926 domain-containing protein [Candidatus Methylacidiphilales bacterium]